MSEKNDRRVAKEDGPKGLVYPDERLLPHSPEPAQEAEVQPQPPAEDPSPETQG